MSKKYLSLLLKSGITVFVLIIGFVSYNFANFWQSKNKCLNKLTNEDVKVSLIFDESKKYSNSDIELLGEALNKINGINNVSVKLPEQVKAEFIDKHKDNQLVLEALKELGENPFTPVITFGFNISNGDVVASEAKRILEENSIKVKTFGIDSKIANRKSALDKYSRMGFFDYMSNSPSPYESQRASLDLCFERA